VGRGSKKNNDILEFFKRDKVLRAGALSQICAPQMSFAHFWMQRAPQIMRPDYFSTRAVFKKLFIIFCASVCGAERAHTGNSKE
jgi:hypothetical protein